MNHAFPSPGVVLSDTEPHMRQQGAYEGMSLRAYFAGLAMQGLLVGHAVDSLYRQHTIAENAVQMADRLLEELAK